MTALEQFVNTTTIDMNFNSSDRTKVQQLSQNLSNIYNSMSGVAKAQVIAVNHAGIEKTIDFMNCPVFFETYDFDIIADKVNGLTNDNYTTNPVFDMIKEEMLNGTNKMPLYEWLINKRLRYQYLTLLAFSILALLALYLLYRNTPKVSVNFFEFYHKNLRGYLFSGFISVGSFLLSLHTFVIINLRDKVFATQEYKEIYSIATGIPIDKINDSVLYKPLDNLSSFINTSILCSITTAIAQFTIGLSTNLYACLFCVWLAILTVFLLLHCLIIIRQNIKILLKQQRKKGG